MVVADFVNPASWSSTAAFLLAAKSRGISPSSLIHHSIMATTQGIEFAQRVANRPELNHVQTLFFSVGVSSTLNDHFYLVNPAVADAGHVLRHFLPSWYKA